MGFPLDPHLSLWTFTLWEFSGLSFGPALVSLDFHFMGIQWAFLWTRTCLFGLSLYGNSVGFPLDPHLSLWTFTLWEFSGLSFGPALVSLDFHFMGIQWAFLWTHTCLFGLLLYGKHCFPLGPQRVTLVAEGTKYCSTLSYRKFSQGRIFS